jgi:NADH-quinone oxidoreductase subunit N
VVILVGRKKDSYLNIYDYSGLGAQHPVLAASMALFMFALAGIPPTAGFVGKFYIFSAAVQAGYIWLAIIGVMNSLVSVFYYLRITVLMYMKPAEADLGPVVFSPASNRGSGPHRRRGARPSASSRAASTTWP